MALFGKKKAPVGGAEGIPTEKVIQMRQQGYSNDQVVQGLQQEGFSSSQIFDAMSQADIKDTAGGQEAPMGPAPEAGPAPMPGEMPSAPGMPPMEQMPPLGPMPAEMPPMGPSVPADKEAIEEIAESIIDEKWDELMKNVDKIVEWKESAESRLVKMEQMINDLKERFEALHKGILSKVSEYDKGIKGVSTDIKAMEEVFKKVLPTFTANVGELSRLTKKMKSPKSRKK